MGDVLKFQNIKFVICLNLNLIRFVIGFFSPCFFELAFSFDCFVFRSATMLFSPSFFYFLFSASLLHEMKIQKMYRLYAE